MNKIQEDKIGIIEELRSQGTCKALKHVLEFVVDKNNTVKLTAIEALSSFPDFSEAKSGLIKLLKSTNNGVRYEAVESLKNFSGDDVGDALISCLKDSNELVRITAIEALGNLKLIRAIPYLQQVLEDNSVLVRGTAAEILGELGDSKVIPILETALKKETRNAARLRFYVGLYLLGEKHYLDLILNMLKNKSYTVRCAAANSLLELADQDNINRIVKSLNEALVREKTIAAKSSISNALIELSEKR